MGFRFSRRWCSTGGGPRGRCPPSWAGTRFFLRGLRPPGFMQGHSPCTHQCRRSAPRPGKLCGAGSPCAHRCEEGLRPSRSKSLDLALRSSPWVGLPGPHPGFLSFHDERNQRRAGATAPGPREGGTLSPLRRRRKASRTPPMGVSDTTKDRFAHPLQADKPVFCSPAVSSREHFWLLICGAGNLRCKMSKSLDILHLSVLY